MVLLLAGDIGGTKTILSLVESENVENGQKLPQQQRLYEKTYPSQDFVDLVPIVKHFCEEAQLQLGSKIIVKNACFGIAGPVINNTSKLTNLNWFLTSSRLQEELFIDKVDLINDFVAISYGILGLKDEDLYTLQDVEPKPKAPIAVLGAGTGLGEGFLIPLENEKYVAFPSEGSHADFAPHNSLGYELSTYIKEKYNLSRISVERVVSGIGISTIYEFLRLKYPEQESEKMKIAYEAWKIKKAINISATISKAAIENNDFLCQQAMGLFIESYGSEAGNLALKLLPYSGLYVAGGIAAKILPLMKSEAFISSFKSKGRMSSLLSEIPVHVILNPKVGLIGAALYAGQ